MSTLHVGMLLYPRLTQLDLTGPYEVFSRMTDTVAHLISTTLEPVVADSGLRLLPTATLEACPPIDVLFVPGGPGQIEVMADLEILKFIAERGASAQYVTSVCTGSLILAAAGLLEGYRAACHWMSREFLKELGAEVSEERVVVDRNRVTGGGVTAGIDFGLLLCALIRGEAEAKCIQLQMEYAPAPPFDSGTPERADPDTVVEVWRRSAQLRLARHEANGRTLARRRGR